MTLTIELPDKLASKFMAWTTEEERNAFFAEAIADAMTPLSKEEQEGEERLLAALNAELDPEKEPERDAAECMRIVNAEIADMDAGIGKSYTLEEMQQHWEAQKAALKAKYPA